MSEIGAMLEASALRVLGVRWDEGEVRRTGDAWPAALWAELSELGLPLALVSEASGGGGLGLDEGLRLIGALAGYVCPAPVPFAESMMGGLLLDSGGIDLPEGTVTIAAGGSRDMVSFAHRNRNWEASGTVARVPWGRMADFVVVAGPSADGDVLALVEIAGNRVEQGTNLAGEPRDTIVLDGAPIIALRHVADAKDTLLRLGAAIRTVQIAAACQLALDISIEHARTRVQFGKPVGKFQAVQQNLAVMAGQTAAAIGAADLAIEAVAHGGNPLGVALGKVRAGEAAGAVAALAHQTVGAIGYTGEHALHRITKRLLSWRDEFGSEGYWAQQIGRAAFDAGGAGFWPLVSATSENGATA